MGKNKCPICHGAIKKKDKSNHECVMCQIKIHNSCATENNLVNIQGLYYCNEHMRNAPKNQKRNRQDSEKDEPLKCFSCAQSIRESLEHYSCVKCSNKFHKNCILVEHRNNLINNYWFCSQCFNANQEPNSTHSQVNNNHNPVSIQDLVNALIEARLSNDHLRQQAHDLEYGERNRQDWDLSSAFAFARQGNNDANKFTSHYMPRRSTRINENPTSGYDYMPRRESQMNEIPLSGYADPQNMNNNNASLNNRHFFSNMPRNNNDDNHHRERNNINLNEQGRSEFQRNEIPRQGINEPRRIPTNISLEELENLVNSSIARISYNNMQHDFRSLTEIQLRESQKNTYRTLPIVENIDFTWQIFYKAFINTKNLFTQFENVRRLQEAIKCKEIKKMGGINLFNLETYETTLFEINKRIGKPKNILIKERSELVKIQHLNDRDTSSLIEFIEQVKQYSSLVDKMGSNSQKFDEDLIVHLSRILPQKLKTQWTDKFNEIEDIREDVQIKDLANFLDQKIKRYETDNMFNKIDPYRAFEKKNFKENNFKESSYKNKNAYENKMFSQVNVDEKKNSYKSNFRENRKRTEDSPAIFCWYHQKRGHSSFICHTLKSKSGKEVCTLAKERNICTICGMKQHSFCPNKNNIHCLIPGCSLNHDTIFCPMRNVVELKDKRENNKLLMHDDNRNLQDSVSQSSSQNSNTSTKEEILRHESSIIDALNAARKEETDSSEDSTWVICDTEAKEMSQSVMTMNDCKLKTSSTLLSIVVIQLEDSKLEGAFLLDSGSTISLIDESWANKINLEGPSKPVKLSWSGGVKRHDYESRIVKTTAKGIHHNAQSHEIYFHTMKNLHMPTQNFDAQFMKNRYPHLREIELKSYSQVIGIIGNDQCWFHRQLKWIETKNNIKDPVAVLTPLGYYVIGSKHPLPIAYHQLQICKNKIKHKKGEIHVTFQDEASELKEIEERLMGTEYNRPYENDRKIVDEENALEILKQNVKKIEGENRYEAPLLWRKEDIKLPTVESLKTSIRRNHIMIKQAEKMGREDEIKSQIENLINKDYARILTYNELQVYPENTFYIPIFTTIQPGKRIRLVWDAACKINGKSLNDYLYTGPNLYVDLLSMLFQMREGKYVIKGDISEMYHQIKIRKKDRPALRFVCSDKANGKINFYEMSSMIFGAICSPTTSQFVKNTIADNYANLFPEASIAIKQNMYVDDYVKSFNDLYKEKHIIKEVRDILNTGGMKIVKLNSNDNQVFELIRNDLNKVEKLNEKLFSQETIEKVLGYIIDFETDTVSMASIEKK